MLQLCWAFIGELAISRNSSAGNPVGGPKYFTKVFRAVRFEDKRGGEPQFPKNAVRVLPVDATQTR
jgi:hypothetical protein